MRFRDAKKLHNGDQVQIKETGEYATVQNTYEWHFHTFSSRKGISIELVGPVSGFRTMSHIEIK